MKQQIPIGNTIEYNNGMVSARRYLSFTNNPTIQQYRTRRLYMRSRRTGIRSKTYRGEFSDYIQEIPCLSEMADRRSQLAYASIGRLDRMRIMEVYDEKRSLR